MSALAILKAEGKAEGEIRGKVILSLMSLLKAILNFPNFNAKQIALFVIFPEKTIDAFLVKLKEKKLKTINAFIKKTFLQKVKLTAAEQLKIDKLLKEILKKST